MLGMVSESVAMRRDYFGSTLRQIALSMVQFAKAVYSENSLELSILVKMFAQHFGHNIDNVIYSGVCSLLVYTHEGKLLSILLSLFPLPIQ